MSQVGKYLNLHPHMQSWSVYNENGPYSKEHAIGALAPATFGGLSYRILDDKGGDIYIINTESFGRCAIWAPRDNDSSITASPVYSNGDTSGGSGGTLSDYLNLHPHMQSWSVYNENGPYSKEHAIGALAPATFGGLSYRILGDKGGDIYIINTESFGRCAIWAPRDNDSSITASPVYSNGDTSGGSGGTLSDYLNLHPHMQSWSVYNENGPYSKEHAIGALAPATFGGLSYRILDDKGGDIYIINTESFGRCAIWAPRDNDSSITASPVYSNGDTSGGGSGGGENPDGNINPFGTKIFIDPGHGGSDPGASGHGLLEKDVVLSIAKKVGDQLVKKGYNVRYSRTTDKYVELTERARLANEWGASLFVSIHANAFNGSARGTECYTHPTEVSQTKKLSTYVASSISNSLGIPNRGHKEEDFSVLRNTKMPAILVETAFIDNASDAVLLKNNQDQFANSIVKSIINNTENPEPELLKYSSNNGIFTGLGVNFIAFDRKVELGTIAIFPKITISAVTSLTAKLPGPSKTYIDLSLGTDELTAQLVTNLNSSGITYNFSKEDLKFSIQKLNASLNVTDVIKYKFETNGKNISMIFETSVSSNGITVYQQMIVTIEIQSDLDTKLIKITTAVATKNEAIRKVPAYTIPDIFGFLSVIVLGVGLVAGIVAGAPALSPAMGVALIAILVNPEK